MQVRGCPVAVGETVLTSLAGANRDPREHPEPERFDVSRDDPHHLSFGAGLHFCLDAHLARMEARTGIGTLFQRFPDLPLSEANAPVRAKQAGFRGFTSMHVRT